MIAFKNLKDILRITLDWERSLKDFYDVAEFALKNETARKALRVLREALLEKLEILKGIKVESYGKSEWIRFALDYKTEDLIPKDRIHRGAEARDIFTHLVSYEEKLANIYSRIAETLVSRSQKELFESLARFKEEQIAEIRRLQESDSPEA
jgi:rubrerythrin